MLNAISIWLLVAGFFGAGLLNAIGTPTTKARFVSWGYPAWWCRLTGGLEILSAVLIAIPVSRFGGLILGAAIIAAAVVTVVRHHEFSDLVPLGVFIGLIAVVAGTSL
jgi:hypothetical protein